MKWNFMKRNAYKTKYSNKIVFFILKQKNDLEIYNEFGKNPFTIAKLLHYTMHRQIASMCNNFFTKLHLFIHVDIQKNTKAQIMK